MSESLGAPCRACLGSWTTQFPVRSGILTDGNGVSMPGKMISALGGIIPGTGKMILGTGKTVLGTRKMILGDGKIILGDGKMIPKSAKMAFSAQKRASGSENGAAKSAKTLKWSGLSPKLPFWRFLTISRRVPGASRCAPTLGWGMERRGGLLLAGVKSQGQEQCWQERGRFDPEHRIREVQA